MNKAQKKRKKTKIKKGETRSPTSRLRSHVYSTDTRPRNEDEARTSRTAWLAWLGGGLHVFLIAARRF
jgi:hypothetical protein